LIDLTPYRFNALIFDCDGTLAHTAPLHFISMREALGAQGHALTRAWYFERVGLSRHDLFEDYQKCYGVPVDVEAASRVSQDVYADHVKDAQPVTEVVAVAKEYYGKMPMIVASGGERHLVLASLVAIGVNDMFSQTVTRCDVANGKPAPDIFLEAAKRLQTPPSECLVFEDSKEGMEAARRAGMQAIDVRPFITAASEVLI